MKYSPLRKVIALLCTQACFIPALAAPIKAQAGGSYTVKNGDTFAKIARSRGISLGSLLKANRISNPDHIALGQRIIMPGERPLVPVTAKASALAKRPVTKQIPPPIAGRRQPGNTTVDLTPPAVRGSWIVRTGDTLSRIQRETGTPLSTLMRLNGLTDTSTLRVGQALRTIATAKITPPAPEKNGRFIREIETPRIIEQPMEQPLSRPVIAPPAAATSTVPHKVQSGENFTSIRRMYGLSSAQLASANRGVNPTRLKAGQTIMIPGQPVRSQPKTQIVRADGRVLAQPTDPLSPDNTADVSLPPGRTRTGYLVEEGESLDEIARRFHTTEGALRSLNRLSDSDNIYGGRYILVPFLRQTPAGAQFANRQS